MRDRIEGNHDTVPTPTTAESLRKASASFVSDILSRGSHSMY